jgi:cytochrome c oxidase subunit 4
MESPRSRSPVLVYGVVFLVLIVITIVELGLSTWLPGITRQVRTAVLMVLSLGKATLVASFYMHLRSDTRLYSYIFLLPAVLLTLFAYLMVST